MVILVILCIWSIYRFQNSKFQILLCINGSKQEILKSMDFESRHFKSIDLKSKSKSKSKYPNATNVTHINLTWAYKKNKKHPISVSAWKITWLVIPHSISSIGSWEFDTKLWNHIVQQLIPNYIFLILPPITTWQLIVKLRKKLFNLPSEPRQQCPVVYPPSKKISFILNLIIG